MPGRHNIISALACAFITLCKTPDVVGNSSIKHERNVVVYDHVTIKF